MRIERAASVDRIVSTVSVVIPCYNYGRYLTDAVGSALNQGVPVEVVIVDDCSTDDSAQTAARLAHGDARVRLVRNETNLGHIATYNKGLELVSGEYVVLLSADDLLAPGSLRRAVSLMAKHPSIGLVYGYAQPFTDSPPRAWNTGTCSIWRGDQWVDLFCRRGDNVVVSPEVVMRTSLLRSLGGYDAASPQAADMLLWLRGAMVADVGRVNAVQGYYRIHGAQMHTATFGGVLTDMRARAYLYELLFGGADQTPAQARRWRWATRSIEREAAWQAALADCAGNGVERAEFVRLADEVTKGRRRSLLWRLRHRAGARRSCQAVRAAHSLKWNLRTRRWRWFGV